MGFVTGDTDLDFDRRYTLADLDAFPEDGRRYELADGWLIVSPVPRRLHQVGCKRLGEVLDAACPPDLFVFNGPITVDDPDRTHFEPDVTVVRKEFATIENGDLPLLGLRCGRRRQQGATQSSRPPLTRGSASRRTGW